MVETFKRNCMVAIKGLERKDYEHKVLSHSLQFNNHVYFTMQSIRYLNALSNFFIT